MLTLKATWTPTLNPLHSYIAIVGLQNGTSTETPLAPGTSEFTYQVPFNSITTFQVDTVDSDGNRSGPTSAVYYTHALPEQVTNVEVVRLS